MAQVLIALGSNLSPEIHLEQAVEALQDLGQVLGVSSIWESDPVGFTEQPPFCNGAVLLETDLTPASLKQSLREIESRLGRVRDPGNKSAPRTIDLDIALYEEQVFNEKELTIPDPEIASRAFLAVPLAELAPDFKHPVDGRTLSQLASATPGRETLRPRTDLLGKFRRPGRNSDSGPALN